jgi:spore photoproduct lyase
MDPEILKQADLFISSHLKIQLGVNKLNELRRLIYEIGVRGTPSINKLIDIPDIFDVINHPGLSPLNRFSKLKQALIRIRYPNASSRKDFSVFLNPLSDQRPQTRQYSEKFVPERIFLQKNLSNSPLAKRVGVLFPNLKPELFETLKDYQRNAPASEYDPRKRDLVITSQKWDFVKACPCTQKAVSCGYHVINLGFGCPFDCSYCFLQQYSNLPGIALDANLDDFLSRLETYLSNFKKPVRIGTGEFSDSLALDHITQYSKTLVPFFADKNALFELKTKSVNIDNLLELEHKGRTVVSWSLNPQSIISGEEHGTPSLEERLLAAKKCFDAGYKIGFHFDPIIHFSGWEKEYRQVIEMMFDHVKKIEWLSLGSFRSNRALKPIIEARFPETKYIYGELIIGDDKKIRYYAALRREIFKKMASWIKEINPKTPVYLCMETKDVWKDVMALEKPGWM